MTPSRALLPAAAALLLLAGCGQSGEESAALPKGAAIAEVSPPAGRQWTEVVDKTPEGGIRMGNPDAAIKLVEYAALTCPHCKDFTAEATEPLKRDYIATGKLSWELRPFLLSGLDVAPTLLVRCQGPAAAFKLTEQTYAAQPEWIGRVMKMPQDELQKLTGNFPGLARATGLDGFFRARGLPEGKLQACLTDRAALDELARITERATNVEGVTGTPSFLINGKLQQETSSWEALRPKLADIAGG